MQNNGKDSKKHEMRHIIMKINRFFILTLAICSVAATSCGKKKQEEIPQKTVVTPVIQQEDDIEEEAPKIITYTVILKDKTLSLYEVNGENKKLITSIEINPEFYPDKDIAKLREGIEAYCKEDGYEILENFAN